MPDDYTDEECILSYETVPIQAGAVLSVGMEDLHVLAVDHSTKTATVIRGWGGSTVEAHDPDDTVWVNPRFTGGDISDAVREEVTSWPPGLFRFYDATHDVAANAQTLELPAEYVGCYGLTEVRRLADPATGVTTNIPTAWPRVDVRLQRGSTSFAGATTSGLLLRIVNVIASSCQLYVGARMPFDFAAFDDPGCDLVYDVGVPESCLDLIAMGVKARLLVDSETERSSRTVQGDPRRAEEVPPGAAWETARAHRFLYERRRAEEIDRLNNLYPLTVT